MSANLTAKTLNESLAPLNKNQSILGSTALSKNTDAKGGKKSYITSGFEHRGAKYELEIISPTTGTEFNNNRKNISSMILKSYQDQPTPYAGVITNLEKCPKKFTPITSQIKAGGKDVFVVKSLVGSGFDHGVCEDKKVTYAACVSFYLDDKNSQYFKLKVYTLPKEDCTKTVQSFFEDLKNQ